MDWNRLLEPGALAMLIPILGVIGWIVAMVIKHRERMAMITNGINPDAPPKPAQNPAGSPQPGK